MTEYIQVNRDQLRVGMRFDYRFEHETYDQQERRITAVSHEDGIEYDWVRPASGRNDHIAMTWDEFEGRTFWVHLDDLHVDDAEAARQYQSLVGTYDEGVRDGYLKAQQENGAKPVSQVKRRDIYREDAILWAIQALGGTPEAAHLLIPLAQQIERYVNGNDEQEQPKIGDRVKVKDQNEHGADCAGVTGTLARRDGAEHYYLQDAKRPSGVSSGGHAGPLSDYERIGTGA